MQAAAVKIQGMYRSGAALRLVRKRRRETKEQAAAGTLAIYGRRYLLRKRCERRYAAGERARKEARAKLILSLLLIRWRRRRKLRVKNALRRVFKRCALCLSPHRKVSAS